MIKKLQITTYVKCLLFIRCYSIFNKEVRGKGKNREARNMGMSVQ